MPRAVRGGSSTWRGSRGESDVTSRVPKIVAIVEMHVIVLHGELNDPKVRARRRDERAANEWEHAGSAEAADGFHGPQRDVDRVRSDVGRPLAVRYARPAARHALAPRAGPAPTPRARGRQEELDGSIGHALIRR